MYRRDRSKTILLYLGGALAVGAALLLIGFFVYTLALRTEYRAFALEVNDEILGCPAADREIARGETRLPLSAFYLDYYDKILLDQGTAVVDRKVREPEKSSIALILGEKRLWFIRVDNTLVNLRWETPEGVRGYTVRCDLITFAQMNAYFTNLARAAG